MLTIANTLATSARSYGTRPAVRFEDKSVLTHAELDEMSSALGAALSEKGIGKGDHTIWLAYNAAEYLLAYCATAKIGATFSGINHWLRPAEIRPVIELLQPAVVFCGPEFTATMESIYEEIVPQPLRITLGASTPGWLGFHEFLRSGSKQMASGDIGEDTVHEIVFTSGSTGQAKGVISTQRRRILDATRAALALQVSRNDHIMGFGPQFHIGGGSVPLTVLLQGGSCTIMSRFAPEAAARVIAANGITHFGGVPAHYSLLAEAKAMEGADISTIRSCYVGGSSVTRHVFNTITSMFPGADIVHGYGSTETGPHVIMVRSANVADLEGRLGLPVPGVEVRVVDAVSGEDAKADEIGEILVRSDSVMVGYFGRPDLTKSVIDDEGWVRTGALARRAEDGTFYFADRLKDMIITGGENVYSREVEDVLVSHPLIDEAAVIGLPDPVYEEQVVAFVRSAGSTGDLDPADVIAYVRQRLAGYKTPKRVVVVADFPRTPTGKIAKNELRQESAPG
jgi:acyl-CoA synthetase (AMP-forming)/AMP-acid ligase II